MRRAEIVVYPSDIERIAAQVHWRDAAYHSRSVSLPQKQAPFAIVTPLGLRRRVGLEASFRAHGVTVAETRPIGEWPIMATRLYVRGRSPRALAQAAAYEQLWATRFTGGAEIWRLTGVDSYVGLLRGKVALQAEFPDDVYAVGVHLAGEAFKFTAYLRAFHVPDPQSLGTEGWLLTSSAV